MPKEFPFYFMKANLCMIQMLNENNFHLHKIKEDLQLENNYIVSQEYFSIYIPSGPTVLKSTQST